MKQLCILILSLASAVTAFAQTKTVTNADLEKYRQERLESERKLRERYAEMGFPSPEQIEQQNRQRRAEMEQYSDQLRERRLQSQTDILARADTLRSQIAALNAQINYLRGQSNGSYNQSFVYSYPYAPYYSRRNYSVLPQIRRLPPNMRTVQEYAAMYPSSQGIYNQSIGNVSIGGRIGGIGGRIDYGKRGYYRGGYLAPVIVGGSYNSNDVSQQIIFLEQQRAGLLAEWQILEEQARRAGIRLD